MRYLAIDLGTSFLKGAVLEIDQPAIQHIRRLPFPEATRGLPPRHVEVPIAAIVQATQALLAQLLADAPDAAGVVVCSQMHGMVLADAQGKALSQAITWQDQRILDKLPQGERTYYDELVARLTPEQIAATGNGLKPSLPLCTLAWWAMRGELPAGAVPVSLPDYVLATIAGTPPVAGATMAASLGMLDLNTGDWHAEMLAALGLEQLQWPRVIPVHAVAYELPISGDIEGVAKVRLPCYAPVGDHQCALVGALLQPQELSLNVSTGSQLGIIVPDFVPGMYETRPYFDDTFLQAITRIPAGRALNALVGLLSELAQAEGVALRDPWGTVAAAVAATPVTDLDMDISFFASPVGDEGHIAHITEENLQVGHLFRAAFGAMARNYRTCANRLAPPQPWQQLVFSGGLVQRFAPLREEIVARFGVADRLCPTSEDTLLGLLALARTVSGRAASVGEATSQLWQHYVDDTTA